MSGKDIGYIRVSTVTQNTERQLYGVGLDRVFEDKCSGRNAERPALKECLSYLRDGDTLHCHSIDRLCRNLRDLLELVQGLLARGVSVVFHKENMRFVAGKTDQFQELQLSIIGAVATFEVALLHERQREGIAHARQRNAYKNCGRKKALSSEQIGIIRQRIANGERKTALAREYGVSLQTVYTHCR